MLPLLFQTGEMQFTPEHEAVAVNLVGFFPEGQIQNSDTMMRL